MRLNIIASLVGLLGLGNSLPWSSPNSTNSTYPTISRFNGTHNITHNNTTVGLPLEHLPGRELADAITHMYNKTALVRRSNPELARGR